MAAYKRTREKTENIYFKIIYCNYMYMTHDVVIGAAAGRVSGAVDVVR